MPYSPNIINVCVLPLKLEIVFKNFKFSPKLVSRFYKTPNFKTVQKTVKTALSNR